MKTKQRSAFTLIEMLVVIAIIATIAAFAVPALTSALSKGQMTGTMNNARQLYLAGYQMALDGAANSDGTRSWPGDYASGVTTLQAYVEKLVQNDYLKGGDLGKILTAPGASCSATTSASPPPISVVLAGTPGVKVYKVKDADPSNTVFAVSANYTYNTALTNATSPYGDKGFIVVHKGGDGVVLRKNNASVSDYGNDAQKFQGAVGMLTGDAEGSPSNGDNSKALTPP